MREEKVITACFLRQRTVSHSNSNSQPDDGARPDWPALVPKRASIYYSMHQYIHTAICLSISLFPVELLSCLHLPLVAARFKAPSSKSQRPVPYPPRHVMPCHAMLCNASSLPGNSSSRSRSRRGKPGLNECTAHSTDDAEAWMQAKKRPRPATIKRASSLSSKLHTLSQKTPRHPGAFIAFMRISRSMKELDSKIYGLQHVEASIVHITTSATMTRSGIGSQPRRSSFHGRSNKSAANTLSCRSLRDSTSVPLLYTDCRTMNIGYANQPRQARRKMPRRLSADDVDETVAKVAL
ncbi:hypothetical protein IWX90DRAFT_103984 [Phyllosticta citrichinensis]|uniref:Uncharacterized protein n=1 Tax=Phyllosticta citrichinensis TaxID=1130410 RepID=A0ABR1Y290_9PEZI